MKYDWILVASIFLLAASGLATLYGIGLSSGEPFFLRQIIFFMAGLLLFFLAAVFDYRVLAAYSKYFYLLAIVLLVLVLFTGEIRGSSRWLSLGFFNLQPAELIKIALVLSLARFFSKKRWEIKKVKTLFQSFLVICIPVVLILLEPDLGSAIMLLILWGGLLLATPVSKKQLLAVFLLAVSVAGIAWSTLLLDYQKERVLTLVQPQADIQGAGYNVNQSVIAVGSGQFWGRGLGYGYQSHLSFLPERHTDFIFASFAEEFGFLGVIVLFIVFSLIIWRLLMTVKLAPDSLGSYIVLGVVIILVFQFIINVGMNLGLLPVTGIPLPLVSYGGSSMLTTMFLLGLTQSVRRYSEYFKNRNSFMVE